MAGRAPRKPRGASVGAVLPNGVEYSENGAPFAPGEAVKVAGERGRFTFRRLGRNQKGEEWYELWGGLPGREKLRSISPERVSAQKTRRGSDPAQRRLLS